MRALSNLAKFLVVTAVAVGLIVLSSCGRSPEEAPPSIEPDAGESLEPLIALDLPLSNTDLGVTLTGIPRGMVVTYNDQTSIEVADENLRSLRYTLFAKRPELPLRSPATVVEFESFIGKHNEGKVTERGDLDTNLGAAPWAAGTYHEEDQDFEDLRVFVPHPSGTGTLIVASVGPKGVADLDDRLAIVKEILTFISPKE